MSRLDFAKKIFNFIIASAKPTLEDSIYSIKRDCLLDIFEFVFNSKPSSDEQKWLNNELELVDSYLSTEFF